MAAEQSEVREPVAAVPPRAAAPGRMHAVRTVLIALLGLAALAAYLYNLTIRTWGGDSDEATIVLQAHAVNSGNVTLDGWRMGIDSFWTIEVPGYALGSLFTGIDPVLLRVLPAIFAAGVVAVGCWLAADRQRGAAAWYAAGTTFVLLALPSGAWLYVFLRGGWHIGTTLWCLFAFAALRDARWGRGWPVAVAFLAAGLLGDLQTVALGVLPVLLAGLVAMCRARSWRVGLPSVCAAGASVLVAIIGREIADAAGTYARAGVNPHADNHQLLVNVRHLPSWLAQVFGVGNGAFGHPSVPGWLAAVHVVGLVAVVAAVVSAAVGLLRGVARGDRQVASATPAPARHLNDMLLLGCLGDVGLYLTATVWSDPNFVRYLAPTVIFGAILAGRYAPRFLAALRSPAVRRPVLAAGAAVAVAYAAAVVPVSVRATVPTTGSDLARFLEARHLTNGIGAYWDANIVTVAAHGRVTVRPVFATSQQRIVRYAKQSAQSWYAGQPFRFLVFEPGSPWQGVDETSATATFGAPAKSYRIGVYQVLVWSDPIHVSP